MNETLVPFLKANEIASLVDILGKKITEDYKSLISPPDELIIVVTLKGAIFFAADLIRKIDVPMNVDFVRVASYGSGTKSSGNVRILKDIETPIAGKHVLVLDEIVDSGRTLNFLLERLLANQPKSVKLAALLSKPSRREVQVNVDYLGKEVPDKFLVGYGLDYAERYRCSADISVLS